MSTSARNEGGIEEASWARKPSSFCSAEDNWPNILVEAGAYGCASVVGPGHGCEEFVREYDFGEVAEGYSAADFARAVCAAVRKRSPQYSAHGTHMVRAAHDPAAIAQEAESKFLHF